MPAGSEPGGRFVKNDPRIRQNLEAARKEEPKEEPPEEERGIPDQLRDMRHVINHAPYLDKRHGQKACRAWFKADMKGFMAQKSRLEAEFLASKGKGLESREEQGQPKGENEERLQELIKSLLEQAQWLEQLRQPIKGSPIDDNSSRMIRDQQGQSLGESESKGL